MDPRLEQRRRGLANRDSDHSELIFGNRDMFIVLKNLANYDHTVASFDGGRTSTRGNGSVWPSLVLQAAE